MAQGYRLLDKSTIVRAIKTVSGRLQRPAFRLLASTAPGLAEAWAVKLFGTPRRARREPPANPPGVPAVPLAVVSGGYRLSAWSWGEGPTVLLVHGWEGHAGQMSRYVAPLLAHGYRTVAFDLPAHGRSSGRRATVLDLVAAIADVARAVGPLHGVVAHSLGGTATALAIAGGLASERVVLLAPAAEPTPFVIGLAAHLGLSAQRADGMLRRVQAMLGGDMAAVNVPHLATRLRAPLFLVHDPADRQVPWEHGKAIAEAWPGTQFRSAPGLGHHRVLSDPGVIAEAVGFIIGKPQAVPVKSL